MQGSLKLGYHAVLHHMRILEFLVHSRLFEYLLSELKDKLFFYFFPFIFISWRLITLQYMPYIDVNQPWIYMCSPSWTPLLPPPIPSLWVFPVHQLWALVSCIQPGLVILFTLDNIHVSMLFSRNIPPSPAPTESKILFCTSVSLSVLHIGLSLPSF